MLSAIIKATVNYKLLMLFVIFYQTCFGQDTTYITNDFGDKQMNVGKLINGKYTGKVKTISLKDTAQEYIYITDYIGGKKEGLRILYQNYEGGVQRLRRIWHCHNDSLEGAVIKYTNDEKIEYIGNMHNNLEDGLWFNYNNGKLESIEEYDNGKRTGLTLFYPNGMVAETGKEIDSRRNGTWIEFDSTYSTYKTGQYLLYDEVFHSNDTTIISNKYRKTGKWNTYSIKGNLINSEQKK